MDPDGVDKPDWDADSPVAGSLAEDGPGIAVPGLGAPVAEGGGTVDFEEWRWDVLGKGRNSVQDSIPEAYLDVVEAFLLQSIVGFAPGSVVRILNILRV